MALKVVVAVVAEWLAAFFADFGRFNVVVSGSNISCCIPRFL